MKNDTITEKWTALNSARRDAWVATKITHKEAPYTTDRDAADTVIEAMLARRCIVTVCQYPDKQPLCNIWSADRPVQLVRGNGDTVPEAVCLAALLYVATYGENFLNKTPDQRCQAFAIIP